MRLSEKLKEKQVTPYQEIAARVGVHPLYVGQIARGQRVPKRKTGKGMQVLQELQKMCNESNI
ncbi:XRE family transcriptional regulator [Bacteroides sp.]